MSESTENNPNATAAETNEPRGRCGHGHCGRGHYRSGPRFFFGKLFFLACLIGIPWAVASHVVHGGHCGDSAAQTTPAADQSR